MSKEWGDGSTDFVGDPRKVFINYLIFLIKEIESRIYLYSKVSTAIVPLMGLVDSLDDKSKSTRMDILPNGFLVSSRKTSKRRWSACVRQ